MGFSFLIGSTKNNVRVGTNAPVGVAILDWERPSVIAFFALPGQSRRPASALWQSPKPPVSSTSS